jgi:hypothetical protein
VQAYPVLSTTAIGAVGGDFDAELPYQRMKSTAICCSAAMLGRGLQMKTGLARLRDDLIFESVTHQFGIVRQSKLLKQP